MKTATVWRALCACSLLFTATSVSRAAAITTAAQWDSAMVGYYGANFVPVKSQNYLPDQDTFAWTGFMWIEAYVAMAQCTGDAKYMATSKEIIDYEISKRDDKRFTTLTPEYWTAPTYYLYYNGVPAKGWRRLGGNGLGEISQLIDGRICESIILWCELARRGFPQYASAVTGYLPLVKETLDMHLPSLKDIQTTQLIPSGHYYTHTLAAKAFRYWRDETTGGAPASPTPVTWSGITPMNHNCTFARAMLGYDSLTGTTTYKTNIQGIINYYLNSLDSTRPTIAVWQYAPLDNLAANHNKLEDVNHAAVTLSLIEEAYRIGGYGITTSHVSRLVQTFNLFYNPTAKDVDNFIDGSGTVQGSGPQTASIGTKSWLWLSQFDPTIATKVRATYNQYFTVNNSAQALSAWANLFYWDSLIAGTAAFDDTSIAATRPLYNDTVNRLLYPYSVQTTSTEVTTGSPPEGTKHTRIDYTITSPTGSASTVYSLSPAEDILVWGGIKITYKNSGPAAWSLLLMDGTTAMTATLPAQATYATRTLRWSDFTNTAAVNKSAITKLRISTTGSPVGSTGQFFFDDVKLIP
ncbi:hypothetical protein [Rariglobus hedericola]|uniref:DUF3131 domain-containing protein n=1 Tax=Rariglobus hedericola TaxID=2597822 RepID=A0A556QEJ5_9BACT|nr:hypothetical protein [Rariglobus hedericola]TSJ75037.1 hypothetical protein FPL22_16700 [Rariglobus hedericola]